MEDSKLVERWGVFETTSMLGQFGIEAQTGECDIEALERNKQLFRDFIACALTQDHASLDRILAPNYFTHGVEGAVGPDGEREQIGIFRRAFPDMAYDIAVTVADGDMVAALSVTSGIHSGEFAGHPATGMPFEARIIDLHRVENGQLVEHRDVYESELMLEQLGISATHQV